MDDAAAGILSGLGAATQGRLAEAGIGTIGALRAIGSVEAYRRLKFMFPRQITLNALYALEAVLRGCHRQDLPASARAASPDVESALLSVMPHFLTANRIHFAEKCSKTVLRREATGIDEALRRGLSFRCRRN